MTCISNSFLISCFDLFLQDNYSKNQNPEAKPKKPRKKTKPSALTRPPKKGKKKKNQRRNLRPQKPIPPSEPVGDAGQYTFMPLCQPSVIRSSNCHGKNTLDPIFSHRPKRRRVTYASTIRPASVSASASASTLSTSSIKPLHGIISYCTCILV